MSNPIAIPNNKEYIPNVFQNLDTGNAGASDLQPPKQTMCKHMVDGGDCKDGDVGAARNQGLKHVRYNEEFHCFLKLSTDFQMEILTDALFAGVRWENLVQVSKHFLLITQAAASRVLCEIKKDLRERALPSNEIINVLNAIVDELPEGQGSDPNAVSLKLLSKIKKTIAVAYSALELACPDNIRKTIALAYPDPALELACPDKLLISPLQNAYQQKSNENLQIIWVAYLHSALVELQQRNPQHQDLVIPDQDVSAEAIQAFLNNDKHAPFLERLTRLDLNNFELTILPSEIKYLKGIQQLYLYNNQLQWFPEGILELTQLQELDLDNNQLREVPQSISGLTKLRSLALNNNQLRELPQSIGELTKLRNLFLRYNKLRALPEEIGNLTALQTIHLEMNPLQWLPESMGKLINLQGLHIDTPIIRRIRQPNTLLLIPDKIFEARKRLGFNMEAHDSNTFSSCFARLYQSILNDYGMNLMSRCDIHTFFNELAEDEADLVYLAISILADVHDDLLAWGKNNAFKDLDRLQKAVGLVITRKFIALSRDQKRLVYDHISSLAGKPEANRWEYWEEKHALDSLAFLAEAMSKLDT